jgi:hypothetical protein
MEQTFLQTPLGRVCIEVLVYSGEEAGYTVFSTQYVVQELPKSLLCDDGSTFRFDVDARFMVIPKGLADIDAVPLKYPVKIRCYLEKAPEIEFGELSGTESDECYYAMEFYSQDVKLTIGARDGFGDPKSFDWISVGGYEGSGIEARIFSVEDLNSGFFLVSWVQSDFVATQSS